MGPATENEQLPTVENRQRDILIERLFRSYGIQLTALDWLYSYLTDLKLSVQFNGDVLTVDSKNS